MLISRLALDRSGCAMPLFDTGDVQAGLASAVKAFKTSKAFTAGLPRPAVGFQRH
ncbi:hypothetical protein [Peterkaempfera sp. SMS 1(5)a]|uniref:hypothetical protein n=1 Tax=Peterkaempfera podocarpi TaxID=3232308 RepID=UPI00366F8F15